MMQSQRNPRFKDMTDNQLTDLYVAVYRSKDYATMTDEQLDAVEAELFWIDDELCARDLDLPSIK